MLDLYGGYGVSIGYVFITCTLLLTFWLIWYDSSFYETLIFISTACTWYIIMNNNESNLNRQTLMHIYYIVELFKALILFFVLCFSYWTWKLQPLPLHCLPSHHVYFVCRNLVWSVKVKTSSGHFDRPITKLSLLLRNMKIVKN